MSQVQFKYELWRTWKNVISRKYAYNSARNQNIVYLILCNTSLKNNAQIM